MGSQAPEEGSMQQRLRRLEALFVVLFAHNGDWPEDERFLREVIVHMGHLPDSAFFEEMLHLVFRRRPRGRLAELEEEISKVERLSQASQALLHEHLSLALLGAEADDIPMRRIVTIRLSLKKDSPRLKDLLAEAVSYFAGSLGMVVSDDLPGPKGSGARKWFARTLGPTCQSEVRERLVEGGQALEQALEARRAHPPEPEEEPAKAAAALIAALDGVGDAVLQVGSILLVSVGGKWVRRSLSPKEQVYLERHRELVRSPEETLQFLGAGEVGSSPAALNEPSPSAP